jgi:hypothetical protein
MTIDTLIPSLRELSHADKLRAIQFLAAELEKEEILSPDLEMSSPYEAFGAADALQKLLDEHKNSEQF